MNEQGKSLKDKEFIHDKNFALKQNERDCPMTVVSRLYIEASLEVH